MAGSFKQTGSLFGGDQCLDEYKYAYGELKQDGTDYFQTETSVKGKRKQFM